MTRQETSNDNLRFDKKERNRQQERGQDSKPRSSTGEKRALNFTCTGPAAIKRPPSPPPRTRPSGPAKEMLIPPDLLTVPGISVGVKDPDSERISNRPYERKRDGNAFNGKIPEIERGKRISIAR